MFFKERIKRISHDDLEFIIRAFHFAGSLEEANKIEVVEWEDLERVVLDYIEWYLAQDEGDFLEKLHECLTIRFPCCDSPLEAIHTAPSLMMLENEKSI